MIYDKLYDWQKNIVNKLKGRSSYGLFLDCGLGKTPLSLSLAEVNNCNKILVITLNNKALETEETSGSWLWWAKQSNMNYTLINKEGNSFDTNRNEIFVINYESLFERYKKNQTKKEKVELKSQIKNFIENAKFNRVAIILDESHKLKNLNSLQTSAVVKIKRELLRYSTVYTYLLTGTAFTRGYEDLYSQLKILGCDMNKTQFYDNFCERGRIKGLLEWQQPIVGYKNIDQLFNLVHQYAITIKSDEVISLPEKIYVYYKTPQSKDFSMFIQDKAYPKDINYLYNKYNISQKEFIVDKKIVNPFYRNIAYPDLEWFAETPSQFWLRARQLSIGFQGNAQNSIWFDRERLNQLKTFLQEHEDNYLLFYNFTPELLEIYEICEELGYNIDIYSGEIKNLNFYEKYSKLDESKKLTNKKNIILANFASGSTGMNWQEYNKCIIFSCPLYKDYEQGIKRIHRIGQKSTVFYYIFYQNNWLDKAMLKSLQERTDYSVDMFNNDLQKNNLFSKN